MKNETQFERIQYEKAKGHCCSQAIMSMALEDLGKENEDLVIAMTGFCAGMGKGEICGALAGGIAALHVCDNQKATDLWQDEFMDWFHGRFGAYDCIDIVAENKGLRDQFCPKLLLETYMHLRKYITAPASAFPLSVSSNASA